MSTLNVNGIISGLDTASIVEALSERARQPILDISIRRDRLQEQKDAILGLSTQGLALKLTAFDLTKASTFRQIDVTSSNTSILQAVGTTSENTGSFDFRVAQLARNAQLISDGIADQDTTTLEAGSFTIELGDGFVDKKTNLNDINAGEGFARGSVRVTDQAGNTEVINLSLAVTVDDVLDAFNSANTVQVSASVSGDGLIITDASGGAGSLTIANVGDGETADSLGLNKTSATGTITGDDINTIAASTPLDSLNDGNGVRTIASQEDLTFTLSDGTSFNVNLDASGTPSTIQDVIDAINNDADNGGDLTASLDAATKAIQFVDNSGGAGNLSVTAATAGVLGTSGAFVDLGLEGATAQSATTGQTGSGNDTVIVGKRLIAPINSLLTRNLNGGRQADSSQGGISDGSITITDRQGTSATIDLTSRVETNTSADPGIGDTSVFVPVAGLAGLAIGNEIRIDDGTNRVTRQITAINTGTGEVSFTQALEVDFAATSAVYGSNEDSQSILNAISNNATINVTASFNRELNGFLIEDDNTATATSDLSIIESGGGTVAGELGIKTGVDAAQTVSVGGSTTTLTSATLAALNLQDDQLNGLELLFTTGANAGSKQTIQNFDATTGVVTFDSGFAAVIAATDTFTITGTDNDSFNGFDAKKKYISENDLLEDLNFGKGVFLGTFQVTDGAGAVFTVDISNETTLGGALEQANLQAIAAGSNATFQINDDGNGISANDDPAGTGNITITDINGGSTAQDLRIAGTNATQIDGTNEFTVTLDGTETLSDVRDAIDALGLDISVTIINDGSETTPFRLNIVSGISGTSGRVGIDDFDNSFNFTTTTQASDAAVVLGGSGDGSKPFLITSDKNLIEDLVPGVDLTLQSISTDPSQVVTVTVERNLDQIISTANDFVTGFNEFVEEIQELTTFDVENEEAALLQANPTLRNIINQVFRLITQNVENVPSPFNRLSEVGFSVKADGTGIDFDDSEFRNKLESNFEDVLQLLDFGEIIQNDTEIENLLGGAGIRSVSGVDDINIQDSNGVTFGVNFDGANTIIEIISAINNDADNPGTIVAALRDDSKGIKITDSSGGSGSFVITNNLTSRAGVDLGIVQTGLTKGSNLVINGFDLRNNGAFNKINKVFGDIVDTGGIFDNQITTFDDQIEDLEEQVARIEASVLAQQTRLFNQFTNLEQTLAELQGQAGFLSAQLPPV